MGWGQLLGGAAGFFLGGPTGALAGAALGGGLDEATGGGQTGAIQQATNAANAQSSAAQALQQRMYDEGVARLQPRLTAGNNALAQMQSGAFAQPAAFSYDPSKYTQSAANAFLTEAGNRNVRGLLASQGRMFSGGALKAISDYNRNAASVGEKEYYQRALDEYNARVAQSNTGYNRLAGLADVGQTAGTQIGTAGQNYATNAGNLMTNQGYNTGNAYLAGERARQSSYGEIGKALGSGGFGSLQTGFNNMFGARQPASSASTYMPSGGYDPYLPYGYNS